MVSKCLVCGFGQDEVDKMHRFPTNLDKSRVWQEAMAMVFTGESLKNYAICSRHFTPDSYKNRMFALKRDAIPTLFPAIRYMSQVALNIAEAEPQLTKSTTSVITGDVPKPSTSTDLIATQTVLADTSTVSSRFSVKEEPHLEDVNRFSVKEEHCQEDANRVSVKEEQCQEDANRVSVKEEQCQEDSFIEDKVCISETAITKDNAEFQGSIWHGEIKKYEDSICLDNVKTELASFEVTEEQNDEVKVEGGIDTDDIKMEFDNGLPYCEHCETYYKDYCIECGMLLSILNKNTLNNVDEAARDDIPNDILEIRDCPGQTGIYALRIIPAGVRFGPFIGLSATDCPWEIIDETFVLDKSKTQYLNWMQYVNPTINTHDRNLQVLQSEGNIYYQSTRQIQAGDQLLVYFGEEYGSSSNKNVRVNFVTTTKDISKDIFACSFCCLGFSSKSHLAKHKTVCVEDQAGKFSIDELTQCPFCKIHLDSKEYLENHMSFCCERNARKCLPPKQPATQATLIVRKRCLRPIYKCEHCKYRTKYQADLKEHTNNQHYEVKVCKCGICNRHFKTKESLRLHVENTHASVGGKDDQEHSSTDHINTHIKVEQSSLQDQKRIFQCTLCGYRAKYRQSLARHQKIKHFMKFNYKCDSCEFGTNVKSTLKRHIKTKHLKEFDHKCDSCQYRTNLKNRLAYHKKTTHLKQFDFKCNSCKYGTNCKRNLENHIKAKHSKEYDFKCDSCDYGTTSITNLEKHIKNKHLMQFDFKCDSCQFGTNRKDYLEIHIKTKHSKKFNFKCDSCQFRTNRKDDLESHIKTKHLKEFDFKCDPCQFRTNSKFYLQVHIKTKHLKEYDYKCDSCEYVTNFKHSLEMHIKTKHLKDFDYKCETCEYRTNHKTNIKVHMKTKHLNEFDYKCDSCEFRAKRKKNLELHIKTKHLKQFNFKCDSCEYRTNNKTNFERHLKAKHLKKK